LEALLGAGADEGAAAGGSTRLQPRALWRAYSLLSFAAHAFVWCDGPDPPAALPAGLAVPWSKVAGALAMPPVLVYSTFNLLNWRRLDPAGPIELGNICCLNNFLGGVDEQWFRLVHISIEAAAAPAVAALEPLQAAAREVRRKDAGWGRLWREGRGRGGWKTARAYALVSKGLGQGVKSAAPMAP
jgi:indoleamine 2,3-dioxygenase